jgi:hypothetical protein
MCGSFFVLFLLGFFFFVRIEDTVLTLYCSLLSIQPYTTGCRLRYLGEKTREFVLSVHCDAPKDAFNVAASAEAPTLAALRAAQALNCRVNGDKSDLCPGLSIHTLNSGTVFSYAASLSPPASFSAVDMSLDFSKSENIVVSGGAMAAKVRVSAGATVFVAALAPKNPKAAVSAAYSASAQPL